MPSIDPTAAGRARRLLRRIGQVVAAAAIAGFTIVLVRALDARDMPPLEPWHRRAPTAEPGAAEIERMPDLGAYLARETEVAREVQAILADQPSPTARLRTSRFNPDGPLHPTRFAIAGNSTLVRQPPAAWPGSPRAGALLLHGLTDAPYSLHAVGELLAEVGVASLALRLPGHGTLPAGLTRADWRDWLAAARLGLRHVATELAPNRPLLVVGYSNGAALAMLLALDAVDAESLTAGSSASDRRIQSPRPDGVLLLSPMVAITPAAKAAWILAGLSAVPGLEQSAWHDILPEYLPFKYTSFPLHAAQQGAGLTAELAERLADAEEAVRLGLLPPVLAFQSLADSTVSTAAVASELFAHLHGPGHELVLFDLNRASELRPFLRDPADDAAVRIAAATTTSGARFTLVTNASPATYEVVEMSSTGPPRPLEAAWPDGVFSLSHVALPFPPDDPLYGRDGTGPRLGSLEPRGEKGVLLVPVEQLMRLTWNPFFPYLAERIAAWVDTVAATGSAATRPPS